MQDSPTQTPYGAALRQLRRSFAWGAGFSAAINLLMLTGPLYMLQIYDRVLPSGSVPTLLGLFAIVLVLYVFMGVYDAVRARILSRAAYRFDEMVAPAAFAAQLGPGRGAEAGSALRDLETVRGFLSGPALRGLFDVPWMPIFLVAVFLIHPWLGYLTLAGAAIIAGVALITQWVTQSAAEQGAQCDATERRFAARSQRLGDAIRALGMQGAVAGRWQALHRAGLIAHQQGGDRTAGLAAISRSFRLFLQSVLLTGGAYLALNQQITAGMIIGASILAGRALAPVDQVIGQWSSIGRARAAHQRLRTVLEASPPAPGRIALPDPEGAVQLRAVTKLAPGSGAGQVQTRILTRISFDLEPGDVLGVLGNSAAGKSSLARVLVGIWAPDLGEVRLDGATLDQWDPDSLGQRIGYLPQHVELLPGSVAENIARFAPDATEAAVMSAARAAGAHEMILGLPEGYATGAGGADLPLSGGQVQRIGLARALYGAPKLVVLDEPNAHLDAQGDAALTQTIRALRQAGSTVVVMAHRPAALAEANKILILQDGQVAEFGPRAEIVRTVMQPVSGTRKDAG